MPATETAASLVNSGRNMIRLTALDLEDVQVSSSYNLQLYMMFQWNIIGMSINIKLIFK